MLSMLIAYDAAGNVTETLDFMCARDETGKVVGLIDFDAHEAAGGKMRDIWTANAVGSGTWPEWIGTRALDFRVERGADGRINALIHRVTGVRRERSAIERAVAGRIASSPERADLRDIVGGPNAPLILDDDGRTLGRSKIKPTPAHLPLVGRQ